MKNPETDITNLYDLNSQGISNCYLEVSFGLLLAM